MPVSIDGIKARFLFQRPQQDFCLDLDVQLPGQGITAIFGASGSGKTSFLRCIAGLERAEEGELKIAQTHWQQTGLFVPTHQRQLGFVFQDAGLLEHLTVQGNLNYAIKRVAQKPELQFYQQIIEVLKVQELLGRYPQQLSGGEKQRVAIARALLSQPKLLLMDEPLASLDQNHKQQILPYLQKIQQWFAVPILYVTHSLAEVSRLADHVLVLEQGKLVAEGKPSQVFSPNTSYQDTDDVITILDARVVAKHPDWHLVSLSTELGQLELADEELTIGQDIRLMIRARDVSLSLSEEPDSSILNRLPVTVLSIKDSEQAAMQLVELASGQGQLLALVSKKSLASLQVQVGTKLWAQVKSASILF